MKISRTRTKDFISQIKSKSILDPTEKEELEKIKHVLNPGEEVVVRK
jgi:hypothetical protein